MANFVGSWKLEQSENMDAVLQKLGINVIKRKLITSSKPEITFTLEGNKMTMKTVSALKTTVISFTFGEEFKEETADGRTVMTTFTKDSDSKISQVQKCPENTTHVVREVTGGKMIAILGLLSLLGVCWVDVFPRRIGFLGYGSVIQPTCT